MHLCIYIDIDIARCSHTGHANDLERWFSEEVHVLLAADDCINGLRAFDVGSMAHCSARTRLYVFAFVRVPLGPFNAPAVGDMALASPDTGVHWKLDMTLRRAI